MWNARQERDATGGSENEHTNVEIEAGREEDEEEGEEGGGWEGTEGS